MITVNNKEFAYNNGMSLRDAMKLNPRNKRIGYIVLVNGSVVRESEYDDHILRDNDVIKIIPVAYGG